MTSQSSAEVKERVQLYFYSPFVPSGQVTQLIYLYLVCRSDYTDAIEGGNDVVQGFPISTYDWTPDGQYQTVKRAKEHCITITTDFMWTEQIDGWQVFAAGERRRDNSYRETSGRPTRLLSAKSVQNRKQLVRILRILYRVNRPLTSSSTYFPYSRAFPLQYQGFSISSVLIKISTPHQISFVWSNQKNEIGGAYGTYGRQERRMRDFGGVTWGTEATWKTQAKMGG